MPFVINCPYCHRPMTVLETQSGFVVPCPFCRGPLTVPVVSVSPSPSPVELAEDEPEPSFRPSRYRRRLDVMPVFLVGGLIVLMLAITGSVIWALSKEAPKETEHAKEPAPSVKPASPARTPQANESGPPVRLSDAAVERIKRATVYIRVTTRDGRVFSGSGFFVSGPGLILTNEHVVDHPGEIEVVMDSGTTRERTYTARVLEVDRSADLALLQIKADRLPEPLQIGNTAGLRETHDVYIFGFPLGEQLGKEITVSKSSVSSIRRGELQLNGGLHPGNSGGPVVDVKGDVVGVAVAVIKGTQINFAIPTDMVRSFLRSARP